MHADSEYERLVGVAHIAVDLVRFYHAAKTGKPSRWVIPGAAAGICMHIISEALAHVNARHARAGEVLTLN